MTRHDPAMGGAERTGQVTSNGTTGVGQPDRPDTAAMTKGERDELAKLAVRRERTAKAGIELRGAELLADVEAGPCG